MAMKIMKCPQCLESFNIDGLIENVDYIHYSTRYYHKSCWEEKVANIPRKIEENASETKAQAIELQNLKDYINDLYHKQCNWSMIIKQIKKYQVDGMTLSGIKKTLYYWYEIKKNPTSKANGAISIVPYAYSQAFEYFKHLYEIEQKNKNKAAFEGRPPECVEIKVAEPIVEKKSKKMFDIGE